VKTKQMIATIKLMDRTVAVAMGVSTGATRLGADLFLGFGGTGLSGTRLSGSGLSGSGLFGTGSEAAVVTGRSHGWTAVDGKRVERSERPVQAPKAVAAAEKYGYAHAIGAGTQQTDQQINLAETAFAADATPPMRAFRGLEPWRERT
jgi:hypothetical protein